MLPDDLLTSPVLIAAVAVWVGAVGGAVGSFLNVVVYRVPAGLSIIHPPSHCPKCKRAIRWRDNLPVLGWVLLRGRCRDCGQKISIRYPLIEAVTSLMFLTVAAVEGFSGGANLPLRPWPVVDGVLLLPLTQNEALAVVAFHLVLLATLLAMALIEYDRPQAASTGGALLRVAAPGLLVGAVAPLVWPFLRPVPAVPVEPDWIAGFADGAAGLGAAMTVGLLGWRFLGHRDRLGLLLGPACAGLFLGWQAGAGVALFSVAVHVVFARFLGRRWPVLARMSPGVWTWAATMGWILGWRI